MKVFPAANNDEMYPLHVIWLFLWHIKDFAHVTVPCDCILWIFKMVSRILTLQFFSFWTVLTPVEVAALCFGSNIIDFSVVMDPVLWSI